MQTQNFHNALTRAIQFVCKHRRGYETTSFEKEQSITKLNVRYHFQNVICLIIKADEELSSIVGNTRLIFIDSLFHHPLGGSLRTQNLGL